MEKKKKVTLVDLAACCGLSKTAVGAILSHDPKYKVSPETKDMVLALAKKMNYKPNLAAKALVSRKHYTVGLLFYSVKDRCYSEIMAAAQQKLAERGYASIFAFWEDSSFLSAYNVLADHGVDGIISNAPEDLADALPPDMPVVLYGCASFRHDAVLVDRSRAIRKVLEYLYENGHRNFGYLCNPTPEPRYRAFLDFLNEKQLPVHPEWIKPTSNNIDVREAAMKEILECRNLPTAIIVQNDVTAMAAMAIAVNAGIKVPEQISFVGFDNILESRYAVPALTTLDIRIDETAVHLVELLMNRIEKPKSPVMFHWIEPELVRRKSCAVISPPDRRFHRKDVPRGRASVSEYAATGD